MLTCAVPCHGVVLGKWAEQVIETQRTQWLDIVRQYKDLFCRAGSSGDAAGRSVSPDGGGAADDVTTASASNAAAMQLLHRWISGRVHWFLGQLSRCVVPCRATAR